MDLQEMKKQYRQIKAPETTFTGNGKYKEEDTMNQFLTQLKTRDKENKKYLWTAYIYYIVLLFLYTGLFLVDPSPHLTFFRRLGGLCLVVTFSFLAAYSKKQHSKLSKIDYDSPTLEFLNRTEERFTYNIKRRLILLVLIFLLIDLGVFLIIYARFGAAIGLPELLLWHHLFFGVIIGLVIYRDIRVYKKKDAPILEQVRELKKTFTADNHEVLTQQDERQIS